MGKVTAKTNVSNTADLSELKRFTTLALTDIANQINGKLTFAENLNISIISVTLGASTLLQTAHNLGRAPIMWIPGSQGGPASVWQTQSPDQTSLYLMSDANVTLQILCI